MGRPVTYFKRQLLMAVILFGATLLLMGFSPQEAQSQEKTAQSQQNAQDEQTAQKRLLDKDPKGNSVAAGELLVSYKRGTSKQAVEETPKGVGGRLEKDFPEIEVQLLSFPEVKNERAQEARQQALERKKGELERNPNVETVDYNQVLEPTWIPNDTSFGQQWDYKQIRATDAWDKTQGTNTVKVAIIDTGIDSTHPDLKGKLVTQYDFANNDSVAEETSDGFNGHGTRVSGIAAAVTNNGTGIAGTCPNCKILMAKYYDETGGGTTAEVISGINWAVFKEANVINMSLGSSTYSAALERAVNYAWDHGAVLVAAAGNNGTNGPAFYPAAYTNVIAVAATDQNDQRACFPNWCSNAGDWVDVAAPGVDIYSTTSTSQGSYMYKSGTSIATPHVSGLAGLLFSQEPISNSEVRNRIEATTVDLGTTGKDPVFGRGRIDAQAAVNFTGFFLTGRTL